jgi:hypothetical protein
MCKACAVVASKIVGGVFKRSFDAVGNKYEENNAGGYQSHSRRVYLLMEKRSRAKPKR